MESYKNTILYLYTIQSIHSMCKLAYTCYSTSLVFDICMGTRADLRAKHPSAAAVDFMLEKRVSV